jgi:hypothetical protein
LLTVGLSYSFASNDEKGQYKGNADQKGEIKFDLAAVERNWKWGGILQFRFI